MKLVAAQAVLRAERGDKLHVTERGQRIERMREIGRHGGRMREQRNPLARERFAQGRIGQQCVDSVFHDSQTSRMKPAAWWKSGLSGACFSAQ